MRGKSDSLDPRFVEFMVDQFSPEELSNFIIAAHDLSVAEVIDLFEQYILDDEDYMKDFLDYNDGNGTDE